MTPRFTWLVLGLLLVATIGCAQSGPADQDAQQVVDRFLAARESHDLDETMASFADQPQMRTSLGISWSGREAVKAIMAYRLSDEYTVANVRVVGDRATWSEHVRRAVIGSPAANFDEDVEAVVVGGRISSMVTYVGGAHSSAVELEAPTPLATSGNVLVPLSVLLLVMAAVMVWPSAEPLPAQRTPNGHVLLDGLREYVARRG
jgi:uncharacterized protein (TIGR02246 family)